MGSLTTFSVNRLLDHTFNGVLYTPPAGLHLCLCSADPTDAATGGLMNEIPDANGYARSPITFGAPGARRITQNSLVAFPSAFGSWGTVGYFAITDNPGYGLGNVLAFGQFAQPFTPLVGNAPRVQIGQTWIEVGASAAGAGWTDYLVHKWLDHMFRNTAFTAPETWLALLSAQANDQAVNNAMVAEVTGTGYARVKVNADGGASPTWKLAVDGVVQNLHQVDFPQPGAVDWANIVAMAIMEATGNPCNVLAYDNANIVDQAPTTTDDSLFFPADAIGLLLA